MPWWVIILLILAPIVMNALVWLIIWMTGIRETGGYAPGWQLRCTKCGRTRDAAEAGVVRIGAVSVGKLTLGRCSGCDDRLRVVAVEKKPTEQP